MRIKEYTISEIFQYILSKFFKTDWTKIHYLAMRINVEDIKEKLSEFKHDVKELHYDDFLKGDPHVFHGEKMELYKKRCKDPNYIAYGIFEDNKLLYSTWISLKKLGLPIEPKPVYLLENEGYLEDSYCDPIARGRGFHSSMNNYRIMKLFELGKDVVVVTVKDGNAPALKAQAKSGMVDLGSFYIGHLGGVKFSTLNKQKFDKKIYGK